MTLQTSPGYIAKQADGTSNFQHPIELMRNFDKSLFGRTGVFRYNDFLVQSTGSGMNISIAAGAANIVGNTGGTQGSYFVWSTGGDTLTLGAASGSTRYDTVLLRVADNQYGTISGAPRAYMEVVAGVAGAGAPRADSYFNSGGGSYQPGAWYRLCDIKVDPGDTTVSNAKITYTNQFVSVPGGRLYCVSTARPSSPLLGDRIFEIDTRNDLTWNGTYWTPQSNSNVASFSTVLSNLGFGPTELDAWSKSWTPPCAGTYRIITKTPFDGTQGDYCMAKLYVNGVVMATQTWVTPPSGASQEVTHITDFYVANTSAITIKVGALRLGAGSNFNMRSLARTISIDFLKDSNIITNS